MTEIERIIDEHWSKHYTIWTKDLAKAIEQYVIKARIEELEILKKEGDEYNFEDLRDTIPERIAQLKKGLK